MTNPPGSPRRISEFGGSAGQAGEGPPPSHWGARENIRNFIGRLNLWTVTAALLSSALALLLTEVWLVLPVDWTCGAETMWTVQGVAFLAIALMLFELFVVQRAFTSSREPESRSLAGARVYAGLTAFMVSAQVGCQSAGQRVA